MLIIYWWRTGIDVVVVDIARLTKFANDVKCKLLIGLRS